MTTPDAVPAAVPSPHDNKHWFAWALLTATLLITLVAIGFILTRPAHIPAPTLPAGTCGPNTAVAYPALGGGVQVRVYSQGPDVVNLDVISSPGRRNHLRQQITAQNNMAEFSMLYLYGVSKITVTSNKFGTCNVPAPGTQQ